MNPLALIGTLGFAESFMPDAIPEILHANLSVNN